jgi:lipopolysaccharide biosynthesis glycosyltransferase
MDDSMPLNLIAASDERYSMALAVMIRSALENLREGVEVDLYVLEDDISAGTKEKIESSWEPYPVTTRWISPHKQQLAGKVQDRGYAGVAATYFRLFIGNLLPPSVRLAIYLDADLIVRGDLAELAEEPFEGHAVMAVPDAYAQYFHISRLKEEYFSRKRQYSQLSRYFNAGLLVIDMAAWRRERIGESALDVAITCKDLLLFHDQDALNVVMEGRWKALHPRWNFHEIPQLMRPWEVRPYSRRERKRIFFSPDVVHFISGEKPWSPTRTFSYYAPLFYDYLSRTRWAGWMPPSPPWYSRLYHHGLIAPHVRMHWCLWRGVIHTLERDVLLRLLRVLIASPWLVLTYPLWVVAKWIREGMHRFCISRKRKTSNKEHGLLLEQNMNCGESHLGGYIRSSPHPAPSGLCIVHGDPETYTPGLWRWVHAKLKVGSVLDLGCGEGHCARFFKDLGCRVLGVDGSILAKRDSVIPECHAVHDFVTGPFLMEDTFDLVWSCEFVEHVEERFIENILDAFRASRRYVMLTYAEPGQKGWHHVNCQPESYWIAKLARIGFTLDPVLTAESREVAEPGHYRRKGLLFVRAQTSKHA